MSLTVAERGKTVACEQHAVSACVARLNDENECASVLMYVCHIMTNVAETPMSRTVDDGLLYASSTMERLNALERRGLVDSSSGNGNVSAYALAQQTELALLRDAATLAKERICWQP